MRSPSPTLEELKETLSDTSTEGWRARSALADQELRGSRVRLRSGAKILNSTHPDFRPGDSLKRACTVTVHSALPARPGERRDDPPDPAEITWAGAGGYWRAARLDDVELILD